MRLIPFKDLYQEKIGQDEVLVLGKKVSLNFDPKTADLSQFNKVKKEIMNSLTPLLKRADIDNTFEVREEDFGVGWTDYGGHRQYDSQMGETLEGEMQITIKIPNLWNLMFEMVDYICMVEEKVVNPISDPFNLILSLFGGKADTKKTYIPKNWGYKRSFTPSEDYMEELGLIDFIEDEIDEHLDNYKPYYTMGCNNRIKNCEIYILVDLEEK